jgi:hypothetical protein
MLCTALLAATLGFQVTPSSFPSYAKVVDLEDPTTHILVSADRVRGAKTPGPQVVDIKEAQGETGHVPTVRLQAENDLVDKTGAQSFQAILEALMWDRRGRSIMEDPEDSPHLLLFAQKVENPVTDEEYSRHSIGHVLHSIVEGV